MRDFCDPDEPELRRRSECDICDETASLRRRDASRCAIFAMSVSTIVWSSSLSASLLFSVTSKDLSIQTAVP